MQFQHSPDSARKPVQEIGHELQQSIAPDISAIRELIQRQATLGFVNKETGEHVFDRLETNALTLADAKKALIIEDFDLVFNFPEMFGITSRSQLQALLLESGYEEDFLEQQSVAYTALQDLSQ